MKRFVISMMVVMSLSAETTIAQQPLTLEACYQRAQSNYPLVRQRQLLEQTRHFSMANAMTGLLPTISMSGQATYQSEVTEIPLEVPGVDRISKDQYRVMTEVAQTVYNGGLVSARRELAQANADAEAQRLETDLYPLQNRINELFFGILLLDDQLALATLVREDLQSGLRQVEAAIANGTALRSAGDVMEAEILRMEQRITELEFKDQSYRQMLGLFLGMTIHRETVLEKPLYGSLPSEIRRPELRWFEAERRTLMMREDVLAATKKPRLELFVQGGYGRPGLNMLDNQFGFYYLGGLRISWLLSGYYTYRNDRQLLDLQRQALDVREDAFLFDTRLQLTQHETEIRRLQGLLDADDKIVSLRTRIRETAAIQLGAGVITSTDFIQQVNAEDQAKQNRIMHETQLLLAQARYYYTSGQ